MTVCKITRQRRIATLSLKWPKRVKCLTVCISLFNFLLVILTIKTIRSYREDYKNKPSTTLVPNGRVKGRRQKEVEIGYSELYMSWHIENNRFSGIILSVYPFKWSRTFSGIFATILTVFLLILIVIGIIYFTRRLLILIYKIWTLRRHHPFEKRNSPSIK